MAELVTWLARWRGDDNTVTVWLVTKRSPRPIGVVWPAGGDVLVGVGYGPFVDDADVGIAATFDEFRALLAELAPTHDYGVVEVTSASSARIGSPFWDRRPMTDVVHTRSIDVLDQVVLDAGPLQLLGPRHDLASTDGLDIEQLGGGRRLVSIGRPEDWVSGATPAAPIIATGRRLLAGLIPSRHELVEIRRARRRRRRAP